MIQVLIQGKYSFYSRFDKMMNVCKYALKETK